MAPSRACWILKHCTFEAIYVDIERISKYSIRGVQGYITSLVHNTLRERFPRFLLWMNKYIYIYTHILTTLRCNWLWLEILSIWQILQLGGETTLRPLWAFLPAGQGPFRQITIADIGVEMSQSKCNIMLEVLQVGSKILNQVVVIGFFRYFHDKKVVQLNSFVDNQQIS